MSLIPLLTTLLAGLLPKSTEDWAVGDLAVCISTQMFVPDEISPKEGDYLRVTHICCDSLFLHFEGKADDRHWLAAHFRKVKPDAEPAADEAWAEEIKRIRQKVTA